MKIALLALTAITLLLVSSSAARAQGSMAPSSQLGIGVNTGGMSIQYAISPAMHIGFGASLGLVSDTSGSVTRYGFGPYARFLFEGPINPFIEAGVSFADVGSTAIGLFGTFGLEYFVNRNVGLFAATTIIEFQLSPRVVTSFGIQSGRAGAEWFFDR